MNIQNIRRTDRQPGLRRQRKAGLLRLGMQAGASIARKPAPAALVPQQAPGYLCTSSRTASHAMRIPLILPLSLGLLLAGGCKSSVSPEKQAQIDQEKIETYVAENNLTGEYTTSGVFVSFERPGTGEETPNAASIVEVIYRGTLLDSAGKEFDSSNGFPVRFQVGNLVAGFQQGIARFKLDAKGIMIIPSRLGYGATARGSIPANSVLIFEVELLDF